MSTITNHYNVSVDSRFYAFLQGDRESADPDSLIATAKKNRELAKEKKIKEKNEKRLKHKADLKRQIEEEAIKDAIKIDEIVCEPAKVDLPIKFEETVELKQDIEEKDKICKVTDDLRNESLVDQRFENRVERGQRGRNNYKKGGRGSFTNDERIQNGDVVHQSYNENYQRSSGNNSGRPYRKETYEDRDDGFNKVGFFEEQPQSIHRGGGVDRRRQYNRGPKFSRNNERATNDEINSQVTNVDAVDNMESEESTMDRHPTRAPRGRYPRANRGGYNRFPRPDNEDGSEFRPNRMGYFDENADGREYRGRGYSRGGRGGRRGRGDFHRRREPDKVEGEGENENESRPERGSSPPVDKWETMEDELGCSHLDHTTTATTVPESARTDVEPMKQDQHQPPEETKNTDWGEIEDDPMEVKEDPKVTMTLEEWRAQNSQSERVINYTTSGKEIRKANDGQDVFSGMSEYRKGKSAEEAAEEHQMETAETHEQVHGRQKQSISMAVRFSRNVDHNDTTSGGEQGRTFSRTYNSRGRGGGVYDSVGGGRGRDIGGDNENRGGSRGGRYSRGGGSELTSDDRNGSEYQGSSRGASEFTRRGRGGSEYTRRGRGASDISGEGRNESDHNVDQRGSGSYVRGRGGSDFHRREQGGSEFTRRGRGGSDFSRRGRGGSDLNGDSRNDSNFVSEERDVRPDQNIDEKNESAPATDDVNEVSFKNRGGPNSGRRGGSEFARQDRGGSDFARRGRGGSDFVRHDRGGSDFVRHDRGGSDFVRHDRGGSDFVRHDRGGSDFVRHNRGGSEFVRRGRGGSDADGKTEPNASNDDRSGSEFSRRDRGGSDFGRRGRGGSNINSDDRLEPGAVESDQTCVGEQVSVRRGRGGSEYSGQRDRGTSYYRGGGGGSDHYRQDNLDWSRDRRVEGDAAGEEAGEGGFRGRGGARGRSNYRGGSRGGSEFGRREQREGADDSGGGGGRYDRGGRDYGRRGAGGSGARYGQYQNRNDDEAEGPAPAKINLGNEDEFPHLS